MTALTMGIGLIFYLMGLGWLATDLATGIDGTLSDDFNAFLVVSGIGFMALGLVMAWVSL